MEPPEPAVLGFYDPANLRLPAPTPEGLAIARGNGAALAAMTATADADGARLAEINVPILVIWGASDEVVDVDYGRAYAAAIPGSEFAPVTDAGHFPFMENAPAVFAALDPFVASPSRIERGRSPRVE